MSMERRIVTIKSRKAVTSLINELIDETILLSLKNFTTEELVKELAGRENVRAYSHKFCDEKCATIEILFETADESLFSLFSRREQA
ncbi:MAG: hypothetical protein IJ642_05495 [Oscillospiraceae bacterium]|nr:hypothetical protein [Oscillospiraceae bacterium]